MRNNRVTFNQTEGKVGEDDYYPFGLNVHRGPIVNPENKYLYSGKELQEELQQYDYGARFYDPVVARFTTVDPLANQYPWYTPYQYGGNEVPNAIDRDGLEPAYPRADGTYTIARDGQLQRPLSDGAAKDFTEYYSSKVPGGKKEADPVSQILVDFLTPILGAVNTLVTGENIDGTKANGFDYAAVPLIILTSLPMEGGEGPGPRATDIHLAVPEATQRRTTIAVADANDINGNSVRIVGSSESRLRPAQRAMLQSNEVEAKGPGHAEVTIINHAQANGLKIRDIGASRPVCPQCLIRIESIGLTPSTPIKPYKPLIFK